MVYLAGSSLLPQSLYHSLSPSSSCSCASQSALWFTKNADAKRKNRSTTVSLRQDDSIDSSFKQRRAFLFVGLSILPLLSLRARALQDLTKSEEFTPMSAEENQKIEQALLRDSSANPILSFLNGLGIITSGVLGALYALAQTEKTASDATISSIATKLKEKETEFFSLQKSSESKLLEEQGDKLKQLRKAKEEQETLINQLSLANTTITGLGQELKNEKRIIKEVKVQLEVSQTRLSETKESKKSLEEELKKKQELIEVLQVKLNELTLEVRERQESIQNLSIVISEKELELENLKNAHEKSEIQLADAKFEIKGLKDEILKNEKQLELKNSTVDKLNVMMNCLTEEKDEYKKTLDEIQENHRTLQKTSEKRATEDANVIGEREFEVKQLRERLEFAMNELSVKISTISDLTEEREDLRKMLDSEVKNVNNLKQEVQITKESLGRSLKEASHAAKQLEHSKDLCDELEAEVSKVTAAFAEAKQEFEKNLSEIKLSSELLERELITVKAHLEKTNEDLQVVFQKLHDTAEERDKLQKELVDVYKNSETVGNELKKEKEMVLTLKKELQAFEKQILNSKESRKHLEADLEEATKSLDEMNRNALALVRDVETSNSKISSLENEKEVLYRTLTEQKNLSVEARENMEDAHNLVMRLGFEREGLENRNKKLEDDLASAKGEILRLRSLVNSSKTETRVSSLKKKEVINDKVPGEEGQEKVTVSAKRSSRRKKPVSEIKKT